MEDMIRKTAVAGQFYPSDKAQVKKQIEGFIQKQVTKKDALGCCMPHAGYIYSGKVAANVANSIEIKDTCILIGPNHTGFGKTFSIMAEGQWQTPLGQVNINQELAERLISESTYLEKDSLAHQFEHSIEVQLPFLKFFKDDVRIVPIIVAQAELNQYIELGKQMAATIKSMNLAKKILLIASSDMTHYEDEKIARKKDKIAIDAILALDETSLYDKVMSQGISMCGYAPVIIMLACVKSLGAKNSELIMYQTSGDTTGDYSAVVGYAGIIIY